MRKKYFSFLFFIIILVVFLFSCQHKNPLKKFLKHRMTDNEYLTMVQEATFRYFFDLGHPVSGLAYDRYPDLENGCVSGGTGMGLMAMIVGVERGFVSREDAANRVLTILNFLKNKCPQYHGAWAHFIDGKTGQTIELFRNDNGGDLIETAFLIQGVLTVHQYFNKANEVENNIRNLAKQMWEGVDWSWYLRKGSGTDINLFGGSNMLWGDDGNSTKSLDNTNAKEGTGYAQKFNYITSTGEDWCASAFSLAKSGTKNLTKYESLTFWIKKDTSTNKTFFKIALKKDDDFEAIVNITDYLTGGVTDTYQKVTIPLSDFSGANLTDVQFLFFYFTKDDLTSNNCQVDGIIYFDDIAFNANDGSSKDLLNDFNFEIEDKYKLSWHWSQDKGWIINMYIEGFNEGMIAYLLAIASPTHSISVDCYKKGWARGGGKNYVDFSNANKWNGIKQYLVPNGLFISKRGMPLFWTHYSYLGFDPRGKKDGIINKYYDVDYFQVFRNISLIDRAYCQNGGGYGSYNSHIWGLTASDESKSLRNGGYREHSAHKDNGTITPTAALSAMAYFIDYTPNYSLDALIHFYKDYGDNLWGDYGFKDSFHPRMDWFANTYLAIDQGPIIVMIENYRTQLLWKYFMSHPDIQNLLNILKANGWTIEDVEY